MVVGNGMLAENFSHFNNNDEFIVFASGVSNSTETDPAAFNRESDLLKRYLKKSATLIYFSTVSIYDSALGGSAYIQHKKKIEILIQQHTAHYIIFRLPQLVGKTKNEHTLTNKLYTMLVSDQPISVHVNACRYLMDVQDIVVFLTGMIISKDYQNKTIDINFNNQIGINNLLNIFERILNTTAKRIPVEKGGCYKSNNQEFLNYLSNIGYHLPSDYIEKVISKYYRQL
ncbi:MAG: hypothetical protein ACHQFW_04940 [Chitinophagales bacterium]